MKNFTILVEFLHTSHYKYSKRRQILVVPKACITLLLSPLTMCLHQLIPATSMHVKGSQDYIMFDNMAMVSKPTVTNETHLSIVTGFAKIKLVTWVYMAKHILL